MSNETPDPLSLLAGLLFTGLGLAFLTDAVGWAELDTSWLAPIVLIVLGAGALVSGLRNRA